MRPKRYAMPTRRVVAYIRPEYADEIIARAKEQGKSIGMVIDELWEAERTPLADRLAAKLAKSSPPRDPTKIPGLQKMIEGRHETPMMIPHRPAVKSYGTICEVCGAVKGKLKWTLSCPGIDPDQADA